MSTVRRLFAIVITTLTAGLLTLVPASAAWAMLPLPEPAGSGTAPTTVGVASAAGGLGTWQVASIAAVCAALAVLATLAVSRFLSEHRQGAQHTAHA